MLNYKELVLESLYKAELIDEELYEKCKPKYITGLPGDLRSRDIDLLQDRYDATMVELRNRADTIAGLEAEKDTVQKAMDKLVAENDELQKNLDAYEKASDKLVEESNKSQKESEKDLDNLIEELYDVLNNRHEFEYGMGSLSVEIDSIYDYFANKGFLTSAEVSEIKSIAENIESLREDIMVSPMLEDDVDDYEAIQQITDSANAFKNFADKYDINNTPIGDTFQEVMGLASQAPDWRDGIETNDKVIQKQTDWINGYDNEISRLENEMDVLLDDSKKTQKIINEIRNT